MGGGRLFKAVKDSIVRQRRAKAFTREQAKDYMLELECANEFESEVAVALWLDGTELPDVYDIVAGMSCREYPTEAKMFCERVMPHLRKLLNAELAEKEVSL